MRNINDGGDDVAYPLIPPATLKVTIKCKDYKTTLLSDSTGKGALELHLHVETPVPVYINGVHQCVGPGHYDYGGTHLSDHTGEKRCNDWR